MRAVLVQRPRRFEAVDRRYHRPEPVESYHGACGVDLNPHHAARTDRWSAAANGYRPCPTCFPDRVGQTAGSEEGERDHL